MGANSEYMEVVYDTGSDWLTIAGTYCENCKGRKYHNKKSSLFSFLEDTQSVELEYGSSILNGLRARDRVCISNDAAIEYNSICLDSFEFYLIEAQTGLK